MSTTIDFTLNGNNFNAKKYTQFAVFKAIGKLQHVKIFSHVFPKLPSSISSTTKLAQCSNSIPIAILSTTSIKHLFSLALQYFEKFCLQCFEKFLR